MKSLEQLLHSYQSFPLGWDGYGGVPAHQSSVEAALTWLATLPAEGPLPLSMLAGDGEVSLYWSYPDVGYLEVSFPGDTTCHFIASCDHERYASDDLDICAASQDSEFMRFYNLAMDNKRNVNETHG
jgi:hypothetical protein